jgi:hypothetical protein
MNNKLFASFTQIDNLEELIEIISTDYIINYDKLFVLYVKSTDEYVITYNTDSGNIGSLPPNTISVHRKKDTNTLYTINALNELIKRLNGGIVDPSFKVNWNHYKNCILLTQQNEFKSLNTKLYKIIEL